MLAIVKYIGNFLHLNGQVADYALGQMENKGMFYQGAVWVECSPQGNAMRKGYNYPFYRSPGLEYKPYFLGEVI